jgi:sugar phosphate isomerase/epimerase
MNRREFIASITAAGAVYGDSKKLKVGCQTNAWKIHVPEFYNLLPVLGEIQKLGYEGFETGYRNVQGQFENLKEARELIRKSGLKFFGCHIFQFEYDPKTSVPSWELTERIAKGAAALGAERLIVSSTAVGSDPDRLRWKVWGLGRAGRLCRDLGMTRLCYHAHAPEFADDAAEVKGLIRETDGDLVRLVVDCGEAAKAKVDVPGFFAKNHKRIEALHLRDVAGVDYGPLAAVVKKSGWQGWLVVEEGQEGVDEPKPEVVGPAREKVRQVFQE